MLFRMIAKNLTLRTGDSGGEMVYLLDPHAGGHTAKNALYSVVVKQKSAMDLVLKADLTHGPDGRHFEAQNTNMINQTLAAGVDLVSGQSDSATVLNEWLRLELKISAPSTVQFATVDVYEMLKPF